MKTSETQTQNWKRREWLKASLGASAAVFPTNAIAQAKPEPDDSFRLWSCGDSHVGTDIRKGYESLASAIRQSEFGDEKLGAPAFVKE